MARTKTADAECCAPTGRAGGRATRPYVQLCKALADETRLEVLGMLAERAGELCACEIEAHFDLSQPTISHHLRVLREAGLIRAARRGTWNYYSLERGALDRLGELRALLTG
ncbi:MAG: metalloregulator ArsR/SmtB family transcription factor [Planctomycetes bacterium]|nr:metalloregulator ArsR/SmtB family transcription factor [Planctomycetota bacterium]